MFLRMKLTVSALIVVVTTGAGVTFAQQPQPNSSTTPAQQTGRRAMTRRKTRGADGHARLLQQLNLTDGQKQQARAIMQANREGNKTQRQEMRQLNQQWRQGTLSAEGLERAKTLRAQLRETRQAERAQMMNVLTAEQKTRLQELRQAYRANHERFGRRRPLD